MSSHMSRALSGIATAALVTPIVVSSAVATTESPTPTAPAVTETQSPAPSQESTLDPGTPESPSSGASDETQTDLEPITDPSDATENSSQTDEPTGTEDPESFQVDRLATPMQSEADSTLTLLNINDFHGRVDHRVGMSLAATVEANRADNPNSIFLSAGDNIGASLFVSSVQQDEPTIDYLNALDLEATALGNYEFDRGADDLTGRVVERANFDHIAANVVDESGDTIVDPYTIVETQDHTVAVIGAVTQETLTLVDPSGVQGLTFTDPVDAVNEHAEALS